MKRILAIVLMCCAFALTLGLVACGGSSSSASSASTSSASASSSAEDPAKVKYDEAVALFDQGKFYSAKAAFEESKYGDWEQRAAACVQPMPETGELQHDEDMQSDNMTLEFVVESANEGSGMLITVYTKDNKPVSSTFIKGTGSVEMGLPGGEYYVRDASGTEWYGDDEQFGPDGHYERMVFDEIEGDPYLTSLEEGYAWKIAINTSGGSGQDVNSEDSSWENRK